MFCKIRRTDIGNNSCIYLSLSSCSYYNKFGRGPHIFTDVPTCSYELSKNRGDILTKECPIRMNKDCYEDVSETSTRCICSDAR